MFSFQTEFAHRKNRDGAVDSICLHRLATVVPNPNDAHQVTAEAAHNCWQKHDTALSRIAALPDKPNPEEPLRFNLEALFFHRWVVSERPSIRLAWVSGQ